MVTSKRQNSYKLAKWDVFRESDKFKTCITLIYSYINKIDPDV